MDTCAINQFQRAYLDSLVCQRISDDEANRELIQTFYNKKNDTLPAALRKGWGADKQDKVAYYIVKEPGEDGEPLLFFSLRCGEVVVPFNREKLRTTMKNSEALLYAAQGRKAPEWAQEIIEKMKVDGKVPEQELETLKKRHSKNIKKWLNYIEEIRMEGENIIRTKQTLAGVELAHFCVHSPAEVRWEAMGMGSRSIGRTMFWKFVVPVIQQIRSLVGCEYLYLFAADGSQDGSLVNYYKGLGFEIREDLYVSKPEYDFRCYFMCQKVTSLRNRQNEFFRSYNAVN